MQGNLDSLDALKCRVEGLLAELDSDFILVVCMIKRYSNNVMDRFNYAVLAAGDNGKERKYTEDNLRKRLNHIINEKKPNWLSVSIFVHYRNMESQLLAYTFKKE